MSAKKTHDLAVVVREYTDREGNTKKQWQNIGARIVYDDGGQSLLIDRHINLAGLPGEGPVRVSLFEPKPRDGYDQSAPRSAPASTVSQDHDAGALKQETMGGQPYDDDIPFDRIRGPW